MPIKPLKSTQDQHNLLIARGLTIKNKDFFIDYINKNNYFNVINGNEDLLLVKPGDKAKNYDTASFDDFVRLHKFDKILTNQVTSILHDFETKLKTSISRHFTESYCRTPENTMQYTNKQNYLDLTTYLGNKYPLYHDQNRKVVDEFHDFFLFKPQFLYFLVKNNDFIDIDIFSTPSSQYTPPSGCSLYEENNKQIVVPVCTKI